MNRSTFWKGFTAGAFSGAAAGMGVMFTWQALASARARRTVRIEESIEIGCPVDAVYAAWLNFSNLPNISPLVRSVETFGARSHWTMSLFGRQFEWDAEVVQKIPNQLLGWKSVRGPRHSGRVNFSPRGNDTLVQVTMNYAPPLAIFSRAAGPVREPLEAHLKHVLRDLKAALERPGAQGSDAGAAHQTASGRFGIDPQTSGHTQHSRFGGPGTGEYTHPPEAK